MQQKKFHKNRVKYKNIYLIKHFQYRKSNFSETSSKVSLLLKSGLNTNEVSLKKRSDTFDSQMLSKSVLCRR